MAKKTGNANKKKFIEPKIKWKNSKAKRLLYDMMMDGTVPLGEGEHERKMSTAEVYGLHPEFKLYDYEKFYSRLYTLRCTIKDLNNRARLDQEAFENFVANHAVSMSSHKGYMQWQGSEAQQLLLQDIEEGVVESYATKKELHESRPEYYENFPLDVFRDKLQQEVRTAKYIETVRENRLKKEKKKNKKKK